MSLSAQMVAVAIIDGGATTASSSAWRAPKLEFKSRGKSEVPLPCHVRHREALSAKLSLVSNCSLLAPLLACPAGLLALHRRPRPGSGRRLSRGCRARARALVGAPGGPELAAALLTSRSFDHLRRLRHVAASFSLVRKLLTMDITVRVEVQYVAPEHARIRDVLQMFRTPAWVRFMVRYISPHLKNAAPADKSVMDSLASWTVGGDAKAGAKRPISSVSSASTCAEDCVICLSELQGADEQFVSLPCGHRFHLPCIRSWLKLRSTCPSCRFQFRKAFSGSYAVRTLNSALLLKQEHRPLPKEQILNTCVGRETVRAVVNVTLSQIAAHAKQSQYPCVLNALMMHSNGDSFTEAAAAEAVLAKSSNSSGGGGDKETDDGGGSNEPRAKRMRVA
ncbi:hypothetical protein PHYPSEUDO_013493 [Phytophthora pseudosyringae]|uniref:RING-type domain-containing protein n=1 Tax=Phytophthora pseudosyringae TaxID=221518 RepID=A0A8T1WID1_9STRA|nr:hypothetical protein PHYPSEUDO_013493 [Phytophthora pseudosyringae]